MTLYKIENLTRKRRTKRLLFKLMIMKMKRIAILGSRALPITPYIKNRITRILTNRANALITTDTKGICNAAFEIARELRTTVIQHRAEDNTKGALYKRNYKAIKEAEQVYIFWDGCSKGTANEIEICRRLNKSTFIEIIPNEATPEIF